MSDITIKQEEFIHLSRLALEGKDSDVAVFLRRLARRYQPTVPELAANLSALLRGVPAARGGSLLREVAGNHVPVDVDSRLRLLRVDESPMPLLQPIWSASVATQLEQFINERQSGPALVKAGLVPARSAIFAGPPGVGKSLAARWIAGRLGLPLLTLDLSAVMSSFLGRTGNNLRFVMDYAKSVRCVLFLDEVDAVAKRRDDAHEMGELKRLVTALLQEVDDWPESGVLLAATNHPALLDPAAWRRFDAQIQFPLPTIPLLQKAVQYFIGAEVGTLPKELISALAATFVGRSFSDVEREILTARRAAVLGPGPLLESLHALLGRAIANASPLERRQIAVYLAQAGLSIRRVSELTQVSRERIRKSLPANANVRRGRPPRG